MSKTNEGASPLQVIAHRAALIADGRESLSEFTAKARLNPMVLMERAITRLEPELIHSINQVHLSIYAAWILQAVKLGSMRDGITAEQIIDPITDKRSSGQVIADIAEGAALSLESWEKTTGSLMDDYSTEARESSLDDIGKASNLAVGKIINVPLGEGKDATVMPMTCIINPRVMDEVYLNRLLMAFVGKDNSMIGRYHRLMAGEFKSFMEYAFALDMIEEDRQLRLDDTDGFYTTAKENRQQGLLTTLITGKKQMNVASNIIMMTKQGAEDLERSMRGKLSRAKDRSKFFKATGSMMLTVVDPVRETVRFYQRGIEQYGIFHYDDLKGASTNPGQADINAILKAYKAGENFNM